METESAKNEIEIDIKGLFYAILSRLTIIILVGILTGGVAFAYTEYVIDPQYVSTTKVYIMYQQNQDSDTLTTSDLTFASYLTNDYKILLKSEPVLEEVKEELNLEQSTETLSSMIEVELEEEDSRVIDISVTSSDPKLAKKIADKVRDVGNEKTKSVMNGIEAINAIDEASLPDSPSSPDVGRDTILGFLIGFALAIIVVAVAFILDDTIKTPDDIEKYLGVSVLASIPLKSVESTDRKKNSQPSKKKKKKDKGEKETKDDDAEGEDA